jgi:acyl carrier protein phosphodiesterase
MAQDFLRVHGQLQKFREYACCSQNTFKQTKQRFKKYPLKHLNYINKTMTKLTDLPNEIILEIASHLSSKDYVSLYNTCHDMRAVLKMDIDKKRKEYEGEEFNELAREYMKLKLTERFQEITILTSIISARITTTATTRSRKIRQEIDSREIPETSA